MQRDDEGGIGHQCDPLKIINRVVGGFGARDRRGDSGRAGGQHQVVAVLGRAQEIDRHCHPAAAGSVFHHNGAAEFLAHRVGQESGK